MSTAESVGLAYDFRLVGDLECVIDLYAEASHDRLQLRLPEQQLNCQQALRATVNQRCLGLAHRVRPVLGAVQAGLIDPVPDIERAQDPSCGTQTQDAGNAMRSLNRKRMKSVQTTRTPVGRRALSTAGRRDMPLSTERWVRTRDGYRHAKTDRRGLCIGSYFARAELDRRFKP